MLMPETKFSFRAHPHSASVSVSVLIAGRTPARRVALSQDAILAILRCTFGLIVSPTAQSRTMIRSEYARIDAKRRSALDPKKRQFAQPIFQHQDYKHRLNFYTLPPTEQITLEEFEEWAISRLKGTKTQTLFPILTIR